MDELAKILGKVAPWLIAAAGGPAGLATKALGTLAEKLGASEATIESVTQAALGATPEQLAATKAADNDFKIQMTSLGFKRETDLVKIYADDRADARKTNVASGMQDKLFKLSLVLLTMSIGSEIWVLFNGLPEALPDMVAGRVLGFLDAITLTVLSYWFSTTFNTHEATRMLANSAPVK